MKLFSTAHPARRLGLAATLSLWVCASTSAFAAVFMANGVKIGDVTQDSAILWTRLTQHPELNAKGNAAFADESRELRQFMATQKNMLLVCGDRHWQYASVDPETGLREYSAGASSDAHAAGFSEADRTPMHRYLKIKGGFLAVTVERVDGKPRAVFRHYGTEGQLYNEDVVDAK